MNRKALAAALICTLAVTSFASCSKHQKAAVLQAAISASSVSDTLSTSSTSSVDSSSAASSSSGSSSAVNVSASSAATKPASTVTKPTGSSAVPIPASSKKSSSPQKTSSSSKASRPTSSSSKPASAASSQATTGLYAPLPTSKSSQTRSYGGGQIVLDADALGFSGWVSSADAKDYLCDDVLVQVTQNGTNKQYQYGQSGLVGDDDQVDVASMLGYYQHGGRPWLTPATYTVHVWCQEGQYSLNKTAGRPQKVDICTFSFSVYERGFK